MMKLLLLLMFIFLIACSIPQAPKEYKTYYVLGQQVQCARANKFHCGYRLSDCAPPYEAYEFECVVNLVQKKEESK